MEGMLTVTDTDRIEALESRVKLLQEQMVDRITWEAEHHGRIEAWWKAQFKWNDKIGALVEKLDRNQTKALAGWAMVLFLATLAANKFL